jgi:hypothetical protein
MDLDALRLALENEQVNTVEEILKGVNKSEGSEALPLLIGHLKITENPLLRNAIALVLRDLENDIVVQHLIDVINDPKTLGARGTLFYALEPFDCSAHLETLVHHLITGNFEVQAQSFQLIESIDEGVSDEVLLKCLIKVKQELTETERRRDILTETLEQLFTLKK